MGKYEVKEERCRLVCLKKDRDAVIENLRNYPFLHLVDTYTKKTPNGMEWEQLIVDSDKLDLDNEFVSKFNHEVNDCLGTFEEYDPRFD